MIKQGSRFPCYKAIGSRFPCKVSSQPKRRAPFFPLVAQRCPFSPFFGSRFPYQVTKPQKGVPLLQYGCWATKVLMGDDLQPTSGTSASTPLIAAMVARWNEDRLMNRLPPLGFLNPLIYQIFSKHPSAFNDVQIGDNRCSRSTCCDVGFRAARGAGVTEFSGSPPLIFSSTEQLYKL